MEYKRLTRRNADGTTWVKCSVCDIQDKCDFTKESCCQELQDLLAELEDKIEQGTLIELPCKVGDIVYAIVFGYDDTGCLYHFIGTKGFIVSDYDLMGKFVFLTREEAEQKLKELEGENGKRFNG